MELGRRSWLKVYLAILQLFFLSSAKLKRNPATVMLLLKIWGWKLASFYKITNLRSRLVSLYHGELVPESDIVQNVLDLIYAQTLT